MYLLFGIYEHELQMFVFRWYCAGVVVYIRKNKFVFNLILYFTHISNLRYQYLLHVLSFSSPDIFLSFPFHLLSMKVFSLAILFRSFSSRVRTIFLPLYLHRPQYWCLYLCFVQYFHFLFYRF